MFRRKRSGSRSDGYGRQLPTVARWSAGLVLGLALLVAVAYLYGNEPSKSGDLLTSLHKTFSHPAVAAVAAFGVAVWSAWCVRQLVFEFQAWWPGRIIVQEFVAGPGADEADVIRLTEAFRERLVRSHLQSPAAVPAPAQQADFLDAFATSAVDPANPVSVITGFLRAARPTHSYEVKGALCHRDDQPNRCGVTIHVERLPGKAGPGVTLWDTDWESAVARASDHATSSIMPRTRRCRPPWSAWRGYRLPGDLLHLYERGVELQAERRFDEALDHYYKAADKDPMNLALRLQIGYLQEKLALFIDALDTYESILAIATPGREGHGPVPVADTAEDGQRLHARDLALTRRARGDRLRRFYRGHERRNRDRVLLSARYRRAILLGGTELPRQWCKQPRERPTQRDAERDALRTRLAPTLAQTFERALESENVEWATRQVYGRPGGGAPEQHRTGKLRKPYLARSVDRLARRPRAVTSLGKADAASALADGASRDELEELFVLASIHELVILRREVPRLRHMKDVPLTRAVVDLSGLCLTQRLKRVQRNLSEGMHPDSDPDALLRKIRKIEGWRPFRRWQEHYNAACAYAIPLLDTDAPPEPETAHLLTIAAVARLERAIECADSGFVASRRDWLLSDDPDLDGLRAAEEFKHFEAIYFPSSLSAKKRPSGLHKWELSRYTLDLLSGTATRFGGCWRARKAGLQGEVEIPVLTDWCDVEMQAWSRVLEVTRNHQHWRARVKLIEFARSLAMRTDFDAPKVRFPQFAELEEPIADRVEEWVRENDDRFEALAEAIEAGQREALKSPLLADLQLRRLELGRLDGRGTTLSQADAAELCEAHATVWQAFGRCVSDSDGDPEQVLDAVESLIGRWNAIKAVLETGVATQAPPPVAVGTAVSNLAPPVSASVSAVVPARPSRYEPLRKWRHRRTAG